MKDFDEAIGYIEHVEKYLRSQGETWYADYLSDALDLLKEQQKLIDEITQRRANNGAFD